PPTSQSSVLVMRERRAPGTERTVPGQTHLCDLVVSRGHNHHIAELASSIHRNPPHHHRSPSLHDLSSVLPLPGPSGQNRIAITPPPHLCLRTLSDAA